MNVPRWPPASTPTDQRIGAGACREDCLGGFGDRDPTTAPASCSRRTTSIDGHPNVNETIGTRAWITVSSLASKSSSSYRGSPSSARSGCYWRDLSPVARDRLDIDCHLADEEQVDSERRIGQRPDPCDVSVSCAALLYPAARTQGPGGETAAVSSGVDGPPAIGAWITGWLSCRNRRAMSGSLSRVVGGDGRWFEQQPPELLPMIGAEPALPIPLDLRDSVTDDRIVDSPLEVDDARDRTSVRSTRRST